MEMQAMFSGLTVLWKRWSEYQVVEQTFNRRIFRYLVPVPGVTEVTYNCAEYAEQMVADALELGRQLSMEDMDKDRLCAILRPLRPSGAGCGVGTGHRGRTGHTPHHFALWARRNMVRMWDSFQKEFKWLYQHFLHANGGEEAPVGELTGLLPYRLTAGRITSTHLGGSKVWSQCCG